MLTCIPQSLCSWNFHVFGGTEPTAITFDFFTEQGEVVIGSDDYRVRKHGPFSGHWSLEQEGRSKVEAKKGSSLFRSFALQMEDSDLTVSAQTPFTRSFNISRGDRPLGTIVPAHPFTRRAFIDCTSEVPELAQVFAFWLAVLTWRRTANDNS